MPRRCGGSGLAGVVQEAGVIGHAGNVAGLARQATASCSSIRFKVASWQIVRSTGVAAKPQTAQR